MTPETNVRMVGRVTFTVEAYTEDVEEAFAAALWSGRMIRVNHPHDGRSLYVNAAQIVSIDGTLRPTARRRRGLRSALTRKGPDPLRGWFANPAPATT